MSYSATAIETYSVADIEVVMRRLTTDLIMIADSTGGITREQAREYGHDIEVLAKAGYLSSVDVTLLSSGVEERAIRYVVDTASGSLIASRPGGVMWPRVSFPRVRVVVSYTSEYTTAARTAIANRLKISWVTSTENISHSSLSESDGRDYSSNAYGLRRKDFTR